MNELNFTFEDLCLIHDILWNFRCKYLNDQMYGYKNFVLPCVENIIDKIDSYTETIDMSSEEYNKRIENYGKNIVKRGD